MHGGADRQVEVRHSLKMAEALSAAGKPYDLKVFSGENHGIEGRAAERDADVVRWFKLHDTDR